MDRVVSDPITGESEASKASRSMSQEATNKQSWTIAVDMAANLLGPDGKFTGGGAIHKWESLQKMAKETANKPVTFVVSVTRPEYPNDPLKPIGEVLPPDPTREIADSSTILQPGTNRPKPTIDTFIITGGQIRRESSQKSLGTAQDVENLLEVAAAKAPSEKLGLVILAHGVGTDDAGISGDAGSATLTKLGTEIKRGLGARDKLDLLVFDGCRMASTETAHTMQTIAKNLVASADHEIGAIKLGFNGLNLNAPMHRLMANPNMTGQDLARTFIDEARNGANGKLVKGIDDRHLRSGADTLIALDLSRYGKFEESLNNFGSLLSSALKDSRNKDAIAAAIDAAPGLPALAPSYMSYQRDSRQFTRLILDKVRQGKLVDDGSIKRAAESLLSDQKSMTIDHHGTSAFYRGIGGLTVELHAAGPEAQRANLRAHTIPGLLVSLSRDARPYVAKELMQTTTKNLMNMMNNFSNEETRQHLPALNNAAKAVIAARTPSEYDQALLSLRKSAKSYLASPFGKHIVDDMQKTIRTIPSQVSGAAWAQFVDDVSNPPAPKIDPR